MTDDDIAALKAEVELLGEQFEKIVDIESKLLFLLRVELSTWNALPLITPCSPEHTNNIETFTTFDNLMRIAQYRAYLKEAQLLREGIQNKLTKAHAQLLQGVPATG